MSTLNLAEIRAEIDTIDAEIQGLIDRRASCAEKVAEAKKAMAVPGESIECYRPAREAEVLQAVIDRNQGPLKKEEVTLIFQEIMSACRRLQKPLNIAYLGPEGTYTQMAAFKHFGHFIQGLSESSIDDVFRSVSYGSAEYGVVPVENSVEGSVTHTVDQFIESDIKICGEIQLPIHHCLLSKKTSLREVKKVYAHQQSLAQCRLWLAGAVKNAVLVAVSSNAEAAQLAAKEEGVAAIACDVAASIYDLTVLQSNIEDDVNNTTRFLVIGKKDADLTGKDKTSLLLSAPNEPGSLYGLLQPLANHKISMSRIESRPSKQANWEYVFFVDLLGHRRDKAFSKALAELEKKASYFKVLGSYPANVH